MKKIWINIVWGIIFLVVGVGLLAGFNWAQLSRPIHLTVFAVAGVVFFGTYFLQGVRSWGWLFPALYCTSTALSIGVELAGKDSSTVTLIAYASMAAPFYVGYALNRKQWGLLIPANLLVSLLVAVSLLKYVNGQFMAAAIFYATALPFLVLYLVKRTRTWALITTAIIAIFGTMPLLTELLANDSDAAGAAFLFIVSLCFIGTALISKKSWWAIIPGGIFASLGLSVVVEMVVPHTEYPMPQNMMSLDKYIWVTFLGLAATFGVVWMLRKTQPTRWALYPAVGSVLMAVLAVTLGPRFSEYALPSTLIVAGGILLLTLIFRQPLPSSRQTPHLKT